MIAMPCLSESKHHDKLEKIKSGILLDIPKSADNFLLNVGTMLANPIQISLPVKEQRTFTALCPWCGFDCFQAHIKAGFLQKDLFKCSKCDQLTSKCVNFASCEGASKGSFVWDEKMCPICEQNCEQEENPVISCHDFFCELPCGLLFTNELEKPIVSGCDQNVRRVSLKYNLDQSIPFPLARHVRKLSSIGIELAIKHNFFEPDAAAARAAGGDGAAPMEPWRVVRDAVLCWPGPERADVARCEELCTHGAFARRWLAASGGDEARAVRRILAHLRWRGEYGVDAMADEVRAPAHLPPAARPRIAPAAHEPLTSPRTTLPPFPSPPHTDPAAL
jgi:hypothetical protein